MLAGFKKHSLTFIFSIFISFLAVPLQGAIIVVHPGMSIQNAINSASDGDTIQLLPGSYMPANNLLIGSTNAPNNLTINGSGMSGPNATTIVCPAFADVIHFFTSTVPGIPGTYYPVIMIDGLTNITISNLIVDGANQGDAGHPTKLFQGIAYHNASGTVEYIYCINVTDASFPMPGSQDGTCVIGIVDNLSSYILNVNNCYLTEYQKNAIEMQGTGLRGIISNNQVVGPTQESYSDENGIIVWYGAAADISNNSITNLFSGNVPHPSTALGIGISNAGPNTTVTNNTVFNNDLGIYANNAGDGLVVSNNTVYNNGLINSSGGGIQILDTAGLTTIENNVMTNNNPSNMNLGEDSSGANNPFHLANNQFNGSPIGLLVNGYEPTGGPNIGPVITMNGDSFVGSTQYYIKEVAAPNDIWPSTATVHFDGLISGQITFAQYEQIRTKILDKLSPVFNPNLGLVLDYLVLAPPPVTNFTGVIVKKNEFLNVTEYFLSSQWSPSPAFNVTFYRIYEKGRLIDEVAAGSPLIFKTCSTSKQHLKSLQISAVNSSNLESSRVKIRITNE